MIDFETLSDYGDAGALLDVAEWIWFDWDLLARLRSGVTSVNEVREAVGLPPIRGIHELYGLININTDLWRFAPAPGDL